MRNLKSQVPSFSFLGGESSQSCSSQNHYPWSIFHLQHSKYFLILLVKKQKIDGRVRPKIKRLYFCFVFFSDHHFVPDPKYCDVHVENMVERNWICLSLWCPHAENLEVRERLLWRDGEGCQHKHKSQLTST